MSEMTAQFAEFDPGETGFIKSFYLVNVLHRQVPEFTDTEMIGLQYELESLSYDGTVDYNEFIRLFMGQENPSSKKQKDDKLKLDVKKSVYSM
jgi:Ca2+-binding EF-hand superfamily protein